MPNRPGPDAAIVEPERVAVAFTRLLRGAGLDVPVGATLQFAEALASVGLERREHVYWAGRSTLVKRPEHNDTYDRAFNAFWHGIAAADNDGRVDDSVALVLAFDAPMPTVENDEDVDEVDAPVVSVRWSPSEVLRHRDFAAYTPAEFAEARRLMADLRFVGALRPSRRRRPTKRGRGTPDVRRTVRRALRAGGEPVSRAFLAPGVQTRRLVLLLDVSGSMEPYARAFVRFLHAAVVGRSRVEAFALGTRVTRITRELSSRDPDAAIRAAANRVVDWSGGTRLGECVKVFNDTWGVRGTARGAVVVILSDGWDRGDPEVLAEQMARLSRVAYKVVWVNPLKATEGYAPLAQGMAAALPHVDAFVEGHSLAALEELAEVISR
ncbi:MAG: VWA domain-containing protein [Actinomycetota bacterium]|nr:VWA domain-containing protein [Actinomycetota bacterium]